MLFSGSQTDRAPVTVTRPLPPGCQPDALAAVHAPPSSIRSVPLPAVPIWNELIVESSQTDPTPDTVTVPTLPLSRPMMPASLRAWPPACTLSVPWLPDSTPTDTRPVLVQVDAAPAPSRPDTVRVPMAPLRLPMVARSLDTVAPASIVKAPVAVSPTVRSPPTVQLGVWTDPGCTSPVPETNWALAECAKPAAHEMKTARSSHFACWRLRSTMAIPPRMDAMCFRAATAGGALFLIGDCAGA